MSPTEKKRERGSDVAAPVFPAARERGGPSSVLSVSRLRGLLEGFTRERRCPACAAVYVIRERDEGMFCPACIAVLARREKGYCSGCGEPSAWPELPLAPCLRCLGNPPPWNAFFFHGLHQGLLQHLLLKLKFHGQVVLAHPLGRLLARHPGLAGLEADCVVPVPLHTGRLARRGYNQALELARPLAAKLGIACKPELLERIRATVPQTGASLAVRTRNTWGAFSGSPGVRGKRILLLDDIVTTGSTLRAAAAALLEAGAAGISVAAVSRTARTR